MREIWSDRVGSRTRPLRQVTVIITLATLATALGDELHKFDGGVRSHYVGSILVCGGVLSGNVRDRPGDRIIDGVHYTS